MADQGRMLKMWFRKAAQDLQTARLLVAQNNENFWGPTVFHAQQCAEKSIKGFLVLQKVRFNKTHDIEVLVNLVASVDKELSQKLESAKILTQFAVAYRYPEEKEPPEALSQNVCGQVVKIADGVYQNLLQKCGLL